MGEVAGARIKARIDQLGWSIRKTAERAKVDKGYLSQLTRGQVPNPGSATLGKIGAALSMSMVEMTGEAEPRTRREIVVTEGVAVIPVSTIRVQADGSATYDDTPDSVTTLTRLALSRADRLKAAVVTGTCMQPHVNPGDVVIFDPGATKPVDGQMVVVVTTEGAALVKWYRVDPLGRGYLRAQDGTELRPNGAKVIGVVVDISRRPVRDPQLMAARQALRDPEP